MDLVIDATATGADGRIATASVVVTVNTPPAAPEGLLHRAEQGIRDGFEHLRGHHESEG